MKKAASIGLLTAVEVVLIHLEQFRGAVRSVGANHVCWHFTPVRIFFQTFEKSLPKNA
jgi:hypothetical protein